MLSIVKNESFVFVVNGETVESNILEAVLISTKVHENLVTTPGNFEFIVKDESIPSTVFKRFLEFAHCHVFDDYSRDERQKFVRISIILGNESLMYFLIEGLSENINTSWKNDSILERTGKQEDFQQVGADHCAS
jgi:hypothetical protein